MMDYDPRRRRLKVVYRAEADTMGPMNVPVSPKTVTPPQAPGRQGQIDIRAVLSGMLDALIQPGPISDFTSTGRITSLIQPSRTAPSALTFKPMIPAKPVEGGPQMPNQDPPVGGDDIADLRSELRQVQTETRQEMRELRTELRGEISSARSEARLDARELRSAMDAGFKDLRDQIGAFGDRLASARDALQSDLHSVDYRVTSMEAASATTRWVILAGLALVTVVLGAVTLIHP